MVEQRNQQTVRLNHTRFFVFKFIIKILAYNYIQTFGFMWISCLNSNSFTIMLTQNIILFEHVNQNKFGKNKIDRKE